MKKIDKSDVRTEPQPRQGWDEAFDKMAEQGDDKLLDSAITQSQWDEQEWDW